MVEAPASRASPICPAGHSSSTTLTLAIPNSPGPPLGDLKAVEAIWAHGTQADDRWLEQIARLTTLQVLQLSGSRVTDAGLVHLRKLPHLKTLDLSGTAVTSRGMADLAGLRSLRELTFPNAADLAWTHLATLEHLEQLLLPQNRLTNAGFRAAPALPRLRGAQISGNLFLDDSLFAHLPAFPELRILILNHTKITAEGVRSMLQSITPAAVCLDQPDMTPEQLGQLQAEFPAVTFLHPRAPIDVRQQAAAEWARSLNMTGQLQLAPSGATSLEGQLPEVPYAIGVLNAVEQLGAPADWQKLRDIRTLFGLHLGYNLATDEHLQQIWQALGDDPRLTEFLCHSDKVSPAGLAGLRKQQRLKFLSLSLRQMIEDSLDVIGALRRLEFFDLGSPEVTDAVFETLARLPELRQVIFRNATRITGKGLPHLGKLSELWRLEITKAPLEDGELAALASIPELMVLNLCGSTVSDDGLAHLARCPRLRVLYLKETWVTAAGVARLQAALPHCTVFWDGNQPAEQPAAPPPVDAVR